MNQASRQAGLYTSESVRVVGADEFADMVSTCRLAPNMVYDNEPFVQAASWNDVQTPMVPYTLYATAQTANAQINFSPLAAMQTTISDMQDERNRFLKDMKDPRRLYQARKDKMYDVWAMTRIKQNDRQVIVNPDSAEARMIDQVLASQRDPNTGIEPTYVSMQAFRM